VSLDSEFGVLSEGSYVGSTAVVVLLSSMRLWVAHAGARRVDSWLAFTHAVAAACRYCLWLGEFASSRVSVSSAHVLLLGSMRLWVACAACLTVSQPAACLVQLRSWSGNDGGKVYEVLLSSAQLLVARARRECTGDVLQMVHCMSRC
jgi:hypothetical protein